MLKKLFLSERNVITAILLNAVLIFSMYFPGLRENRWLELLDQLFLVFFVAEAIVKIHYLKPKGYFSQWWNRFDFLVVIFSLPYLLVHYVNIPDAPILILLRMFRLIRLVRFIRFIPNLDKIMEGLGRALRASVFVLLALLVLDFLLALFTCHFFAAVAPEQFGNPLIAAYSIFQLFTIEGWHEITAQIVGQIDNPLAQGLTRIWFVIIVLTGGIFGLSLANAVFVDEMTLDNNRALEEKIDELQRQMTELKDILRNRTS